MQIYALRSSGVLHGRVSSKAVMNYCRVQFVIPVILLSLLKSLCLMSILLKFLHNNTLNKCAVRYSIIHSTTCVLTSHYDHSEHAQYKRFVRYTLHFIHLSYWQTQTSYSENKVNYNIYLTVVKVPGSC